MSSDAKILFKEFSSNLMNLTSILPVSCLNIYPNKLAIPLPNGLDMPTFEIEDPFEILDNQMCNIFKKLKFSVKKPFCLNYRVSKHLPK